MCAGRKEGRKASDREVAGWLAGCAHFTLFYFTMRDGGGSTFSVAKSRFVGRRAQRRAGREGAPMGGVRGAALGTGLCKLRRHCHGSSGPPRIKAPPHQPPIPSGLSDPKLISYCGMRFLFFRSCLCVHGLSSFAPRPTLALGRKEEERSDVVLECSLDTRRHAKASQ